MSEENIRNLENRPAYRKNFSIGGPESVWQHNPNDIVRTNRPSVDTQYPSINERYISSAEDLINGQPSQIPPSSSGQPENQTNTTRTRILDDHVEKMRDVRKGSSSKADEDPRTERVQMRRPESGPSLEHRSDGARRFDLRELFGRTHSDSPTSQ